MVNAPEVGAVYVFVPTLSVPVSTDVIWKYRGVRSVSDAAD